MPDSLTLTLTTRPGHLRRTGEALAHATSADAWRGALEVRAADATVAPAVRVGIAAAVTLVAGGLLGQPALAGIAALGALTAAFARHEPYPRLAAKLAVVAGSLVSFVVLGAVAGVAGLTTGWQIVLLSSAAGLASLVLGAFRITGPGAVIFVFAAMAAVGYSHTAADLTAVTLAVMAGALVGWVAALTPAAFVPMGAARLATARALAAVARLGEPGPGDPAAARGALAHAREVVAVSARGEHGVAHAHDLTALLADADLAVERWLIDGDTDPLHQVAVHEQELRKVKRHISTSRRFDAPELPLVEGVLATGARRLRARGLLVNGARIAAASALAGWVAAAAGLGHPLWASLGAIAAMQGLTFSHTAQRAIARLLGNVGGAVIAALLIAAAPNYWQAVVVIVALQVVAELLVVRNYALTSLAVTPMALLMVGLGTPVTPDIAVDRVLDTLVGAVVGVVVAAVTLRRPVDSPTAD
ncbi:FUSC family protein [Rhodococcus kronopolitis]|uniref:FUSC family protein n=1 Tax=Rhodococcus kronopolitis TaxID=1460226 RepID=A0ABV9FW04_9NOCA